MKNDIKRKNLWLIISYPLLTIISVIILVFRNLMHTEYLYNVVYLITMYFAIVIILILRYMFSKVINIFNLVVEWTVITFIYFVSFIIVCVLYALLLDNNLFDLRYLVLMFCVNLVLISIILFCLYSFNRNEVISIIRSKWWVFVESLFILSPLFLIQVLLVRNDLSDFNFFYLYSYIIFVTLYISFVYVSLRRLNDLLRINSIFVLIASINVTLALLTTTIKLPNNVYVNSILYNNETFIIITSIILLMFGSLIYSIFNGINVKTHNKVKEVGKRLLYSATYFIVSVIFYIILVNSMHFTLIE